MSKSLPDSDPMRGRPSPASDTASFRFDVFLSHAREDKTAVRALAQQLRAAGLTVWLDEEILAPGFEPRDAIVQGIAESRHVLIWVTDAWLRKAWTRWELGLFAKATSDERRVIPVMRVPWDDGVLGPYLTQQAAVPTECDEYERLWLVVCGVQGQEPGARWLWANRGREPIGRLKKERPHLEAPVPARPWLRSLFKAASFVLALGLMIWAIALVGLMDSSRSPSVIACTIRVEGGRQIERGWVIFLDSGEIYSVDIEGETILFRCPPEGCEVAVVVDLHNGEIRYWSRIFTAPGKSSELSLATSKEGAPEIFRRLVIGQEALGSNRSRSLQAPTGKPGFKRMSSVPYRPDPMPANCKLVRKSAIEAKTSRQWNKVLRNTSEQDCWDKARRLERSRLRVEAYAELGRFNECVTEGADSTDREILPRVRWCRKRRDG